MNRSPAAPVLLRSCVLKATGAGQDDFVVDLGQDIEFNPVLRHYLAPSRASRSTTRRWRTWPR